MNTPILYEEAYEYNSDPELKYLNLHFDYGRRYHEINMTFQHFHPYYEIYILLQGQAQHIIEGNVFQLNEHDIVLLNPYLLHKSNYYKNIPCSRLIISFNLLAFEMLNPEVTLKIKELFQQKTPILRFNNEITTRLIELFNKMFLISKRHQSLSDFLITSHFIQFFALLLVEEPNNIYMHHQFDTVGNLKIQEIVTYIHEHYAENLSLESLAKTFFISPPYLSKKFKQTTHFNLIEYINQTKVKRAQELLLNTDFKIINIIDLCGFGSLSQFNRVFRRITNMSPSDYRKTSIDTITDNNMPLSKRF